MNKQLLNIQQLKIFILKTLIQFNLQIDKKNITYNSHLQTSIIETGDEEIRYSLIDDQNKQTIGAQKINISNLKNQQTLDTELQLQNDYGNITGTLKVQMRWIYSKVKYLEDVLNKWQEYADSQSQDLEDYQRDLLTLYEPFKQLQIFNRNKQNYLQSYSGGQNLIQFNEEQQIQVQQFAGAPRGPSYKASFLDQNQVKTEGGNIQFIRLCLTILSSLGFHQSIFLNPGNQLDYKKISVFATLGYLCMVLFVSFERSMFFDLLVIFKFYDYHIKEEFTGQIYKNFAIALFISFVVFDLGWIVNYTRLWFGGDYPDNGMKQFVDLFTILLFLCKLFIMGVYLLNWQNNEQMQNQQRQANLSVKQKQDGSIIQPNDNIQQYMVQSKNANYLYENNIQMQTNPKFSAQLNPSYQQYVDTMKTTRHY